MSWLARMAVFFQNVIDPAFSFSDVRHSIRAFSPDCSCCYPGRAAADRPEIVRALRRLSRTFKPSMLRGFTVCFRTREERMNERFSIKGLQYCLDFQESTHWPLRANDAGIPRRCVESLKPSDRFCGVGFAGACWQSVGRDF